LRLAVAVLSVSLKDDGYDIADYYGVHADYGTVADCRAFIAAAHTRGIRGFVLRVLLPPRRNATTTSGAIRRENTKEYE